jgi:hypothetical protein
VAVKKAYGKKNPEIQNAGGDPLLIHLVRKEIRSKSSLIHEANGFNERKPLSAQIAGT